MPRLWTSEMVSTCLDASVWLRPASGSSSRMTFGSTASARASFEPLHLAERQRAGQLALGAGQSDQGDYIGRTLALAAPIDMQHGAERVDGAADSRRRARHCRARSFHETAARSDASSARPRRTRAAVASPVTSTPASMIPPAIGPQHPGHDPDQRGLAGTVRPDQADEIAGSTANDTPATACTPPNRIATSSSCSAALMFASPAARGCAPWPQDRRAPAG